MSAVLQQQLLDMLAMQDKMNTRVNPQWREQDYAWYRAIWTECAELMDHFGWKWWKKQKPDLAQIHLEIVDIWHFGMSMLLQQNSDHGAVARQLEQDWNGSGSSDFLLSVEALATEVLTRKQFPVPLFCQLMTLADFSADQLYRQYIGKNVLNFFRQDHGYQEGHYHKKWRGREDNEHLAEVLGKLDATATDFAQALYAELQARYPV